MDIQSLNYWTDYSKVKDNLIKYTHAKETPWFDVPSDIKKHARLNCIKHLLDHIPYDRDLKPEPIDFPKERKIDDSYVRLPEDEIPFIDDWVAKNFL